jgi:hypothetical protein
MISRPAKVADDTELSSTHGGPSEDHIASITANLNNSTRRDIAARKNTRIRFDRQFRKGHVAIYDISRDSSPSAILFFLSMCPQNSILLRSRFTKGLIHS